MHVVYKGDNYTAALPLGKLGYYTFAINIRHWLRAVKLC